MESTEIQKAIEEQLREAIATQQAELNHGVYRLVGYVSSVSGGHQNSPVGVMVCCDEGTLNFLVADISHAPQLGDKFEVTIRKTK